MPIIVRRDPLRLFVSKNLPILAWLGSYFILVVAGNIIYASTFGPSALAINGFSPSILKLEGNFSVGYWILLLSPFVVAPVVTYLVRLYLKPYIELASSLIPELSGREYLVLMLLCYGFLTHTFIKADVLTLMFSANDAVSSVNARFAILNRIGFFSLMVLQAILPFLAISSSIRWMRDRTALWLTLAVFNVLAMSAFLILINMKWPILLFYIGIVLAIFVNTKRYAYSKTLAGGVVLVAAYLLISTAVFRIAGEPVEEAVIERTGGSAMSSAADAAVRTSEAAFGHAPMLLMHGLNRMAVVYPFYYDIFTREGAVCGGLLGQLTREPICRPSNYVYVQMFGTAEGFTDPGTAPQGAHISSYALGGWPLAAAALLGSSILVGLFSCLPLDRSASLSALAIVGALAGYHLSQVPAEGVLFFDHGLIWTFMLIGALVIWRQTHTMFARRRHRNGRERYE